MIGRDILAAGQFNQGQAMPIWTVEGADKATGKDVVRSIDAPTEELAREEAIGMGVLVSDVHRSAADPDPADRPALNYSGVKTPKATSFYPSPLSINPEPHAPDYPAIVAGARLLNLLSLIFGGIGAITLLISILAACVAVWQRVNHSDDFDPAPAAISGLLASFGMLTVYAVLRLLSASAMAVRDVARHGLASRGKA